MSAACQMDAAVLKTIRRMTLYDYSAPLSPEPAVGSRVREIGIRLASLTGAIACAAALLFPALPVSARTPDADTHSVLIRTDDLNLSRPAGQKTLQARLRSAERTICSRSSNGARAALAEARCLRSVRHSAPGSE